MAKATLEELENQARWEVHWCANAIKRYRETVANKPIADLPSGQAMLRTCVPPLMAAIKERQSTAAGLNQSARGHNTGWHGPVLALEPDQLAVLTICSAFRAGAADEGREGRQEHLSSIRSVATKLSSYLGSQLDYNQWVKDAPETVLESVLRRYPSMTRQAWSRVKRKLDIEPSPNWPVSVRVQIGTTLLGCLLDACPDYFSMRLDRIDGGRTENTLVLSNSVE